MDITLGNTAAFKAPLQQGEVEQVATKTVSPKEALTRGRGKKVKAGNVTKVTLVTSIPAQEAEGLMDENICDTIVGHEEEVMTGCDIKENVEMDGKRFQCLKCGKELNSKNGVDYHMRTHTGFRPFQCDLCFKRFKSSSLCSRHRHIHSTEKKFMCKICDKNFAQKTNLVKHNDIHATVKRFQCPACPSMFTQKVHLDCHTMTHTKSTPWKCDQCHAKFSKKSSLLRHCQNIHHIEREAKQDQDEPVMSGKTSKEFLFHAEHQEDIFMCKADGCDFKESAAGWQQRMLYHFFLNHDLLVDSVLVHDVSNKRNIRVQDIFKSLGQCSQQDCLLIDGVVEGDFKELNQIYKEHYNTEHSGCPVDFIVLIDNHRAKFATKP